MNENWGYCRPEMKPGEPQPSVLSSDCIKLIFKYNNNKIVGNWDF